MSFQQKIFQLVLAVNWSVDFRKLDIVQIVNRTNRFDEPVFWNLKEKENFKSKHNETKLLDITFKLCVSNGFAGTPTNLAYGPGDSFPSAVNCSSGSTTKR